MKKIAKKCLYETHTIDIMVTLWYNPCEDALLDNTNHRLKARTEREDFYCEARIRGRSIAVKRPRKCVLLVGD